MDATTTRFDAGMSPLKMKGLLKGLAFSPTFFSKRQELFAALQHLGWHIKPTIDAEEINGIEDYRDEATARKRLAKLQAQAVHKPGQEPGVFIRSAQYSKTIHGYTIAFDGWRVDETWAVTDPAAHLSFTLRPEIHDRNRKRDRIKPQRLGQWLKAHTSVQAQAKELLEQHEQQRRSEIADTDSGTCGVCLRNIKLEDGDGRPVMVLHGYKRPGTGQTHGRCMGVGTLPYELSAEATEMVLKRYERSLEQLDQYIESLIAPGLTEFVDDSRSTPRVVTKEQAGAAWRLLLDDHIAKQRTKRFNIKYERDIFHWLVHNWRLRPLPVPGQQTLSWYDEAARHVRQSV